MKTIYLGAFLLFSYCTLAQTPGFNWVKPIFTNISQSQINAEITDLDTDPAGNTYITGEFNGSINFGSGVWQALSPKMARLVASR